MPGLASLGIRVAGGSEQIFQVHGFLVECDGYHLAPVNHLNSNAQKNDPLRVDPAEGQSRLGLRPDP